MNYWLMKSEPETFGIDDLTSRPEQTEPWDGVRNYQARNMMRDQMKIGDQALFYHSNCAVPGVVAIVEIVREGYPDHTAFDPESNYHDPKSDPDKPRWFMVDVRYIRHLERPVSLAEMRTMEELDGLPLLRRGNRLSVMPVEERHWQAILERASEPVPTGGCRI
jgi:predicted RNA-binding protein with PUA-like domain